jgi:hypothetical protein
MRFSRPGMSVMEKAARETMVDDALITIGKKLVARGQELSPAQTSHNYAVSLIANQPEAKGIKKAGTRKRPEPATRPGQVADRGDDEIKEDYSVFSPQGW